MRKNKDTTNLLDLIPVRNLEWVDNEQNLVVLLKPKFSNRWLAKYILPRMKRPNYRISLDAFGSAVWNSCDGKNTVAEIGEKLKKEFGDRVEPVYERLALFFQQLERSRFIRFQDISR